MQNLVWDFDGTLFDTYPHILRSFRRALTLLSLPEEENLDAMLYASIRSCERFYAEKYGIEKSLLDEVYQKEENGVDDADVLPFYGMKALLIECKTRGYRHFLYTHRSQTVYPYLDKFGFLSLFTDFITGEDPFPSKPAPDALLFLSKKHSLPAKETLMIGDRVIDVEAGLRAGMQALLFDPKNHLEKVTVYPKAVTIKDLRTALLE